MSSKEGHTCGNHLKSNLSYKIFLHSTSHATLILTAATANTTQISTVWQ